LPSATGLNSTYRKISNGEGVERTFQNAQPADHKIEVKRRGDASCQVVLLAQPGGKSARIKEKLGAKAA
jgi:ribosomal protein L19